VSFSDAPALPRFIGEALPFPRRMFALSDGRRLHFIDTGGDAPVVLLVHGNPTWSFLWRKVIARLPDVRCVAPDLLGFGLSSKPSRLREHSIDMHADAIEQLVQALDLRRFVIVGQDWGGPIGTAVGERMRERVAGLVLGNTSVLAPANPRGTWFHRFARTPVVSDLAFRLLGFPQIDLGAVQGDRSSIRGSVSRAYRWPLRRIRDRAGPLALARMVPDRRDHPSMAPLQRTGAWLETYDGPMALVWGTRDPILGRALGKHEQAFPHAKVTVTDAGHFLQEEVPDAIAEAVRGVLSGGVGLGDRRAT
jgi:pimeloyl-ACP methyl ester carboxylesterase